MFDWHSLARGTTVWTVVFVWLLALLALWVCVFMDWEWIGWNIIDGIVALVATAASIALFDEL